MWHDDHSGVFNGSGPGSMRYAVVQITFHVRVEVLQLNGISSMRCVCGQLAVMFDVSNMKG